MGDVVGAFESISTIAVNKLLSRAGRNTGGCMRTFTSTSCATWMNWKRFGITSPTTRSVGWTIPITPNRLHTGIGRGRARPTLAGRWPAQKVDGRNGHWGEGKPTPYDRVGPLARESGHWPRPDDEIAGNGFAIWQHPRLRIYSGPRIGRADRQRRRGRARPTWRAGGPRKRPMAETAHGGRASPPCTNIWAGEPARYW